MSDKILSREVFKKSLFVNSDGYSLLLEHDAALRLDRDQWKALAEAQPGAVQSLVDALVAVRKASSQSQAWTIANRALKAYEEVKAKC